MCTFSGQLACITLNGKLNLTVAYYNNNNDDDDDDTSLTYDWSADEDAHFLFATKTITALLLSFC